jgi:hypothetical protein
VGEIPERQQKAAAVSNRMKPGSTTARVQDRHGRKGHVTLTTSVPPELKDHLVELAAHRGSTLKDEIEAALRAHIYGVDTDRDRWYGG